MITAMLKTMKRKSKVKECEIGKRAQSVLMVIPGTNTPPHSRSWWIMILDGSFIKFRIDGCLTFQVRIVL